MAYILHNHLPPTMRIRHALTKIFGIGAYRSDQICDQLGFQRSLRVHMLSPSQVDQLTRILTQYYYKMNLLRNKKLLRKQLKLLTIILK